MNRMEINGPGADYQIQMKKLLSGDSAVSRVEAYRAYSGTPSFEGYMKDSARNDGTQSLRWMDRYLLNLNGIKDTDTITVRGNLCTYGNAWHSLGDALLRPNTDQDMLKMQTKLIAEGVGLQLTEYIDLTTRIKKYSLRIPFDIQSDCIRVELDYQENSYIVTIQELEFKRKCNEVLQKLLTWWDRHMWQQVSPEVLFLKRFCDIKSDRIKSEEQKRSVYEQEQKKQEHTEEWEARTLDYVKGVDWDEVGISLGFAMIDPMGAAVELHLENLPENALSREGILLPKKLHFAEQDQGIIIEKQLNYVPEDFKTRLLCAMVKHMNESYKIKQPDFYEYKKWHIICERRDFAMKFSKKFTYYSDEQLGIVQGGISFAEWSRNIEPGGYEQLFDRA